MAFVIAAPCDVFVIDLMLPKKDGLSSIHDLRTPITRIHGLAEAGLMASSDSSSGRGEMLGAIISKCHHLTAMINTMLEIARTDSGIMRLERKPVDMSELLHEGDGLKNWLCRF